MGSSMGSAIHYHAVNGIFALLASCSFGGRPSTACSDAEFCARSEMKCVAPSPNAASATDDPFSATVEFEWPGLAVAVRVDQFGLMTASLKKNDVWILHDEKTQLSSNALFRLKAVIAGAGYLTAPAPAARDDLSDMQEMSSCIEWKGRKNAIRHSVANDSIECVGIRLVERRLLSLAGITRDVPELEFY